MTCSFFLEIERSLKLWYFRYHWVLLPSLNIWNELYSLTFQGNLLWRMDLVRLALGSSFFYRRWSDFLKFWHHFSSLWYSLRILLFLSLHLTFVFFLSFFHATDLWYFFIELKCMYKHVWVLIWVSKIIDRLQFLFCQFTSLIPIELKA